MHRRRSLSGRLAALLLTLLFVLVLAYAAEAAASFSDVSADAWYAEAVQYVWEQGWMTGTDAAAFSPDLVMTRGMLVTVLYRAAGSPALEDENLGYPFTDVPGSAWYADGVYWARLTGIADGYGNNLFGPDDPVTREQLVTLLWRWSGQPDTADGSQFDDEGGHLLLGGRRGGLGKCQRPGQRKARQSLRPRRPGHPGGGCCSSDTLAYAAIRGRDSGRFPARRFRKL